jgi:hypothetical protein
LLGFDPEDDGGKFLINAELVSELQGVTDQEIAVFVHS